MLLQQGMQVEQPSPVEGDAVDGLRLDGRAEQAAVHSLQVLQQLSQAFLQPAQVLQPVYSAISIQVLIFTELQLSLSHKFIYFLLLFFQQAMLVILSFQLSIYFQMLHQLSLVDLLHSCVILHLQMWLAIQGLLIVAIYGLQQVYYLQYFQELLQFLL